VDPYATFWNPSRPADRYAYEPVTQQRWVNPNDWRQGTYTHDLFDDESDAYEYSNYALPVYP
jgi:hypothetical protein